MCVNPGSLADSDASKETPEENNVKKWKESQWTEEYEVYSMNEFKHETGIAVDMAVDAEARAFFELFFTDEVLVQNIL